MPDDATIPQKVAAASRGAASIALPFMRKAAPDSIPSADDIVELVDGVALAASKETCRMIARTLQMLAEKDDCPKQARETMQYLIDWLASQDD